VGRRGEGNVGRGGGRRAWRKCGGGIKEKGGVRRVVFGEECKSGEEGKAEKERKGWNTSWEGVNEMSTRQGKDKGRARNRTSSIDGVGKEGKRSEFGDEDARDEGDKRKEGGTVGGGWQEKVV